jgi:hypothetical protein
VDGVLRRTNVHRIYERGGARNVLHERACERRRGFVDPAKILGGKAPASGQFGDERAFVQKRRADFGRDRFAYGKAAGAEFAADGDDRGPIILR